MRALVFKPPWELVVETLEDPRPAPGEVLIRVAATGICGSDVHGFTGANGRRHPGQVMGHETVGVVEEVGADVDPVLGLRPGATVTVNPLLACGDCPACDAGSLGETMYLWGGPRTTAARARCAASADGFSRSATPAEESTSVAWLWERSSLPARQSSAFA